jgi:DNA-binding transcriptional MocR family regulator
MAAPRYKHLVSALAADIRAGRLAPGARLPTHRQLAAREGIALVTATRVYAQLDALGLVSREQGRGTFVRSLPADHGVDMPAVAGDAVDLNFNYPSVPGQAALLRQALRELASSGDLESLLRYQPHAGPPADRAVIAEHLGTTADRVLIVNGAQHGLAVTLMALLRPGDAVGVDALTYPGFKVLADLLHLGLVPGLPPDADADVRAIYTMPTVHNPLGSVMSLPDRERLVSSARRRGLILIEDASYAYLEPDPPPSLMALAPDITVHVSGLSKSVATGLRVGFVVAPPALVPALERAIRATTWNTPALATAIACRWIADGTVADLQVRKRLDATARQAVAREELLDLPRIGHASSYFTWLPLPPDARADRLAATLADRHVSVSTAEPFATTRHTPQALRLALGSTPVDKLRTTLRVVLQAVREEIYR